MKRALATAIGICLTWALFLGASGDVGISSSLPQQVGMSNDLASAMGGSYSGAGVDTFKLLVQNSATPPTIGAVPDSGLGWIYADAWYDSVLQANDGSTVRWGCTRSSAPTVPYFNVNGGVEGRAVEYDRTPPTYQTFIAFNIGEIPVGSRIESASFFMAMQRFGTNDISTGYVSARIDTVVADYAMLNSTPTTPSNGDANWLETSANEVDITHSVAWTPALSARDDFNDFGPRADAVYAPGTSMATDGMMRLDVTDGVQQVLDNANTGGWVILVIYNTGTVGSNLVWSFSSDPAKVSSGSPALSVVSISRRGIKPWGGTVPIVAVWDDNKDANPTFWAIEDSAGYVFSSASYRDSWNAGADSIWTASGGNIDILVHTKTHTSLGTLTASELDYDLARDWLPTEATGIDTLVLDDFAWVGGGTMEEKYSLLAINRMVANNYATCRATTYTEHTPIGDLTYPAWDQYVNLFAVQSLLEVVLMGSATQAIFNDELTDMVDDCWTNHYRSAVMIYGHGWVNGARPQTVRWLMEYMDTHNNATFRTHDWVMGQLSGRPRVLPSAVTMANGATAGIEASAAMYDSALMATPAETWPEQVWVGPK